MQNTPTEYIFGVCFIVHENATHFMKKKHYKTEKSLLTYRVFFDSWLYMEYLKN